MTAKTIRLPDEMSERLRAEAFERRTSQQSIVEEALRLHWERRDCTCAAALDSHAGDCPALPAELARS